MCLWGRKEWVSLGTASVIVLGHCHCSNQMMDGQFLDFSRGVSWSRSPQLKSWSLKIFQQIQSCLQHYLLYLSVTTHWSWSSVSIRMNHNSLHKLEMGVEISSDRSRFWSNSYTHGLKLYKLNITTPTFDSLRVATMTITHHSSILHHKYLATCPNSFFLNLHMAAGGGSRSNTTNRHKDHRVDDKSAIKQPR